MKKFVTIVLALMVVLSICATAFATTSCTSWLDTGDVKPRSCVAEGCGVAGWMKVMKGSKTQKRACASNDSEFKIWDEEREVVEYGDCC